MYFLFSKKQSDSFLTSNDWMLLVHCLLSGVVPLKLKNIIKGKFSNCSTTLYYWICRTYSTVKLQTKNYNVFLERWMQRCMSYNLLLLMHPTTSSSQGARKPPGIGEAEQVPTWRSLITGETSLKRRLMGRVLTRTCRPRLFIKLSSQSVRKSSTHHTTKEVVTPLGCPITNRCYCY